MTLELTETDLIVKMRGVSGVLALTSRIDVPITHVLRAGVTTATDAKTESPLLKTRGTRVPGLVQVGSYGSGDERQFWYVAHAEQVLFVDLNDESYRRLVLELDGASEVADRINAAIAP